MPIQLTTTYGENLPATPWQTYPRPQMRRNNYVNLNGTWDFTVREESALPREYDRQILLPFCPESQLSGIGAHHTPENAWLFYRRRFRLPTDQPQGRWLLHIGAADQYLTCYVNGNKIGKHHGGYEAITFDITDSLQPDNTLELRCRDDLRRQEYPYGKQTLTRGGMWYTPVSGVWQTVWLEWVPEEYIQTLTIENRGTAVTISITPALTGTVDIPGLGQYPLSDGSVTINPENPHFWSPEDPYLYDFTVKTQLDAVESYFAIRILDTRVFDGIPRLCLNGKPYFFHGLLDQGYWPDGLLTPADPRCYPDDILAMKKLGFNMLRKHIKVEPEEFYYQCDRLGMVVFQDMVNNGAYNFLRDTALPTVGMQKLPDKRLHPDQTQREGFLSGMRATVNQLGNHPCICYWTIFNEGWGQFDSDRVYDLLRQLDSTRFIDSTSGWFRQKRSDVESLHIYFGSWDKLKKQEKPLVLSEFGGYAYRVEDHIFNPEKAYGYKSCKSLEDFRADLQALYMDKVLPAVKQGLCAAVYTQVSDVEDEINGLLTYDRRVCKADAQTMCAIAQALQSALTTP